MCDASALSSRADASPPCLLAGTTSASFSPSPAAFAIFPAPPFPPPAVAVSPPPPAPVARDTTTLCKCPGLKQNGLSFSFSTASESKSSGVSHPSVRSADTYCTISGFSLAIPMMAATCDASAVSSRAEARFIAAPLLDPQPILVFSGWVGWLLLSTGCALTLQPPVNRRTVFSLRWRVCVSFILVGEKISKL